MPDLKESVQEMENLRKRIKDSVEKSEDKDNPAYVLYDSMIESVIDILNSDVVKKSFELISAKLAPETVKPLIELMAVCMANSAHQAICIYDNLLKEELTQQFDRYGDVLNNCIAIVNAHDGAIKVLRKTITDTKNEIEELKDKN